jgi:hypothetical protein
MNCEVLSESAVQLNSMLVRLRFGLYRGKGDTMLGRSALVLVFIAMIGASAYSQQSVAPAGSQRSEWEYLVISYGQAYFGSPIKTESYLSAPSRAGQEAVSLQKSLDNLGKVGWELVAVIGIIGGDQELILKRKNDPNLTKKERDIFEKQKAKALTDFMAQMRKEEAEAEKVAKLAAEKKVLIDLDQQDERNKMNEQEAAAKSYFAELAEAFNSDNLIRKDTSIDGLQHVLRLQYDLTASNLDNVNEYRKSDILKYLTDKIESVTVDRDRLWIYDLQIVAEAYLKFNGKLVKVAEQLSTSEPTSRSR